VICPNRIAQLQIGAFDLDNEGGSTLPDLFPVLGMKQRGAHIRTNFGWLEFCYDLRNIGNDQHNVVPIRSRVAPFEYSGATEVDEELNYGVDRKLQRWIPEENIGTNRSLSWSGSIAAAGIEWDQFEVNRRLYGVTTDYDETMYTTAVDKSHPDYDKRVAEADKVAREIERSHKVAHRGGAVK
jgi:hypothetical protein